MNISDAIPLKIVVVGDAKVGKTTLIQTYLQEIDGNQSASKLRFDYKIVQVEIQQEQYCVAIWDSVGQGFQNQMSNFLVKDADAVMLCIDLSKEIDIQSIDKWMDTLINRSSSHCAYVLIGTKLDLFQQGRTQHLNDAFSQISDKYSALKLLTPVQYQDKESIKLAFQQTFEQGVQAKTKSKQDSTLNFQSFVLQKDRNSYFTANSRSSSIKIKNQKKDQCC
ncbi:unnamed protein product (macronuclear) [Paramecium tetraurelia]|uniref:Chromosome undetermined scaffold_76, whole genome shotgun sequence n=1 Tax=Paramecium tetraurelia TaxID=5888 RepID=Q3SDT5_PARTE|nr:uncharacterized protein GSPATT00022889001 [Paramecium tetraurelia]CAI39273.1 rab_C83 [Paramecium tetraurelia]CAK89716.1 unnamed protein product [Paramecium tetraurelia]|eukprot:XP_001457113.1 hypothetical protein (macronuclear) [Paramecium tetraurelia strain d4-2]